ncbi:MAG: 6,7-dimethyl-8-ribityllumazine synthase [Rhodospirillales bacterium]|nr:6,7-dimethyl-8-ribityllumazine synthase [Rhodospirillales bacterium]
MGTSPHIMIVESRYYELIAEELINSVLHELKTAGATYERFEVPGAFEIPAAIKFAIDGKVKRSSTNNFDGFVALGCVIRGQTTHYDYVCGESARGLQDLALKHSIALGYGILTVENQEQAMARAKRSQQDRGGHAARACLKMIELKKHFEIYGK